MKIYRVTRITFDQLENQISDAISKKLIGNYLNKSQAEATIATAKVTGEKPYKAWDGEYYPKYLIVEEEVEE